MNVLLLEQAQLQDNQRAQIHGRQLEHLVNVLGASRGDTVKIGLINGSLGSGTILSLSHSSAEVEVTLSTPPPPPLPVTLLLSLPRPKMMRRVLQSVTSLGVKDIYLINSWRVEKSYWQSPWLSDTALRQQLVLGLEQGIDTVLPRIQLKKRFKPFVEDELPTLMQQHKHHLVAHPHVNADCPTKIAEPTLLAVGPEGGFIPYELEKLQGMGFSTISLGSRILRVETALPTLMGKLFL